jgi:ferredoxin
MAVDFCTACPSSYFLNPEGPDSQTCVRVCPRGTVRMEESCVRCS